MRILIEGQIQNFDNSDLLKFVDPDALAEAKKSDPHPQLKGFVIAHEGESESKLIGFGQKVLRWFRKAIDRVYDVLKIGTPVFSGHNADNSTEGRTRIGQVLGKFQNMTNGINRVVSIIQIFNPFKDRNFDIASFEGDIKIPDGETIGASDLKEITGIALAEKSLGAKPAFPGAEIIGAFQMLENGGNKKMELSEVMKVIEENKWTPSDLFDDDVILKLPIVMTAVDKESARANNQEHAFKRLNTKIEEQKSVISERDKTIRTLKTDLINKDTSGVFTKILEERKIEDQQLKDYINLEIPKFKVDDPEADIKAKANEYIDHVVDDFGKKKGFFIPDKDKQKDPGGQSSPNDLQLPL